MDRREEILVELVADLRREVDGARIRARLSGNRYAEGYLAAAVTAHSLALDALIALSDQEDAQNAG